MKLTSTTFDFCEKVGLLQENFTRETMLNHIIADLKRRSDEIDNDFIKQVSAININNVNRDDRVAVMYHYDINVTYKINGREKKDRIGGFGNTGTPDALKVTSYYKDGDYAVIKNKDASVITTSTWNDKNIFTFEQIKSALKGVIEENLPKNWQSYSSSDWTVSAYIVPIFSFDVEFNGKTYVFSANLHNGHYHFHYPKNLKLEKKAKKARSLGRGLIVLGLFVSLITLVASILAKRTPGIIMSLVMGVANIITLKNHNTSLTSIKRKIAKHKKQSMSAAILPEIIMAVLSSVVFGISMM